MNRRTFLASATVAGSCGLAGCLDALKSDDPPEPVEIAGEFDDDHGMEIGPHGGANAQIFYEEETPPDREDGPFWFHTLVFSGLPFHFDRLDRGWEPEVIYVTDFSAVDWTVRERDGAPRMPSPTEPGAFADADDLTYVVDSDVMGGMGPDLHPFSAESEAETVVDEHGGRMIAFEDVTWTLVEELQTGGHGHDDDGHDDHDGHHDGHGHDDDDHDH